MVNRIAETPFVQQGSLPLSSDSFKPSKPALLRLMDFRTRFGKTENRSTHLACDRLEREYTELQDWIKKQLEQKLNQSWTDTAWSYLTTVTSSCLSIFNLILGYSAGNSAGVALVAAGAFEILQTLFKHYGTWDAVAEVIAEKNQNYKKEEIKKYLQQILPSLNFVLSCLGASALAHQAKGLTAFKDFLNFINGAGHTGSQISNAYATVETAKIDGKVQHHTQNTELFSRLLTDLIEEAKRVKTLTKKGAETAMQASTLAAQKIYR